MARFATNAWLIETAQVQSKTLSKSPLERDVSILKDVAQNIFTMAYLFGGDEENPDRRSQLVSTSSFESRSELDAQNTG